MAFISSAKNSHEKEEVNTASIPNASTNVSPASANIGQIKWNMALLSMRADRYWKRTGKKITIQANEEENHALVADEEAPTEFALMAKTNTEVCPRLKVDWKSSRTKKSNSVKNKRNEKEGLESKLTGFKSATKDLDHLIGSQRSDKIKEGLGYSVVPPPPAQVYSSLKKDMSWTGLFEFADDTVTDYTRPSPSVESNPNDLQHISSSASENGESTSSILSKPEINL
nr:hypothetical protein [Tanacetum cinerariifolium]